MLPLDGQTEAAPMPPEKLGRLMKGLPGRSRDDPYANAPLELKRLRQACKDADDALMEHWRKDHPDFTPAGSS